MPQIERAQLVQVAELAAVYGVLWHHCRDGRACMGDPGLPDLVIAGHRGVLFRELKSSTLGVRPQQTSWRLSLRAAGADVGIWFPSHFRSGAVEREIAALQGLAPGERWCVNSSVCPPDTPHPHRI